MPILESLTRRTDLEEASARPEAVSDGYPLSPTQAGMLYQVLLDDPGAGASGGYDIEQLRMTLDEPLDPDAFGRAMTRVVRHLSVLSTSFHWEQTDEPRQRIEPHVRVPVQVEDWRGLDATEREKRMEAFLVRDRDRGFDLQKAPLMRITVFPVDSARTEVIWTFHHILLDGRSLEPIMRAIFEQYDAIRGGSEVPLPVAPRPYRDYAEWIARLDHGKSLAFFHELLAGKTTATPLPGAEPASRPLEGHGYGEIIRTIDAGATAAAVACAKRTDSTLNTLVQAAWSIVLARYGGDEDVLFGATRACRRSALNGDAERMIGLFINTLPVRARVGRDRTVRDLLVDLRTQSLAIRPHENTPLALVQGQSTIARGSPLLETLLMFENRALDDTMRAKAPALFEGRHFAIYEQPSFPLNLTVFGGETLEVRVMFDRRRYRDAVVERLISSFSLALRQIAEDENRPLGQIDVVSPAERRRILVEWNDTARPFPDQLRIHELFEATAVRQPNAPAVEMDGAVVTYAELDARANRLAHALRARGARPGAYVGICLERGIDLVVTMLGVAKSGAAYVPLDPRYPTARLDFMLQDTGAIVCCTDEKHRALFSFSALVIDGADAAALAAMPDTRPPPLGSPTDHCYVIYTSGSTGKPKGVVLSHRAVLNTLDWVSRTMSVGPGDRLLFVTSPCFDLSVYDTFGALGAGATVVVASDAMLHDPAALAAAITEKKITIWDSAPAALERLVAFFPTPSPDSRLRLTMLSGDWIPLALPGAIRSAFPGCRVISLGGATEAAIWSNWFPVGDLDPRWTSVPYGRPIQNARYHVLDARMQPVPIGVAGDLYIGGACLAQGYLHRPDITEAAFIADPLHAGDGERLYRTGDLARYFEDGNLEFLGRADFQIKVRGFRVELGEVEAALVAQPGVRQGVCAAFADASGQRSLAAYLVAEPGVTLDTRAVRQGLTQALPEFMVPSHFMVLDALPMSENGKVDRKALPSPTTGRAASETVAPRTEAERVMTSVWEEVLQTKPIGVTDDFFEIGGHSLLAVVLVSRIKSRTGTDIPLSRLLECPTIESLVASIARSGGEARGCVVELKAGRGARRLFLVHDGDGETLLYRNLAKRMPDDVTVYGVAPLSSGRLRMVHSSVADMAAHYISEIRKYQPQGPYYLGGLCAGGVIAFEAARQLEQEGQTVNLLALMEAAPPRAKRRPLLELSERWSRFSAVLKDLTERRTGVSARHAGRKIANLVAYELRSAGRDLRSAALVWVLRRRIRTGEAWPADLPVPSVREVYLDAAARYVARRVAGARAIVFRANEAVGAERPLREILCEPHFGWQNVLDHDVEIVDVEGGHSTMLQEPHVDLVAHHLRRALEDE